MVGTIAAASAKMQSGLFGFLCIANQCKSLCFLAFFSKMHDVEVPQYMKYPCGHFADTEEQNVNRILTLQKYFYSSGLTVLETVHIRHSSALGPKRKINDIKAFLQHHFCTFK